MLHTIGFDKVYERAEGAYFWDAEGNDYLDMLAGFGVMGLGRHHPVVRKALHDVAGRRSSPTCTRFDCQPLPGLLAEKLLAHAPHLDRVFFGNSGTEAVETALKFARYATGQAARPVLRPRLPRPDHRLAVGQRRGRASATASTRCCPTPPSRSATSTRWTAELRAATSPRSSSSRSRARACTRAPPGFLRAAQDLLHRHKALLIADEVQTGLGRTGDFFAYQHEEGVEPDLVCVAKALSGGYVPVGATLGKDWIFKKVYSSMDRVLVHSASFGSNAQAMAAGLAVAVRHGGRADRGERPRAPATCCGRRLTALVDRYELLADVRGRGLMIGIEFGKPPSLSCAAGWTMLQAARKGLFAQMVVVPLLQRHRILTQVSGDHLEVIKLIPPLIIGEREVDRFVEAFTAVMDDAHEGGGLMWDFGRTLVKQAVRS